ncbi:uncharacterized protein [Drosophila virilis]|uniref:Uncharacterized protein, isoform B n=1 Tax=Drosophila virilis TaxID=7244 RepID=A0A0Q9WCI7_DROVI|nr:uncharacterized protein LOC6633892 isoform X2 [Drosophila virilis]KRF77872.1 uncharacterized protein Dvir_GJ18211, isoform B [Drosophila virilis]
MACKQPTSQQLAYLDELKMRLQELRKRQETFMEETAQILRNISTDRPDPLMAVPPLAPIEVTQKVDDEECVGNIKQLIQRFEDLRQTSRQFSDQPMPEELVGVDVRKLLKGYERLIVEGNILQKSWLLLKKTTESCAQHTTGRPSIIKSSISLQEPCFGIESSTQQAYNNRSGWTNQPYGKANRQRLGAFLQLVLRINPFNRCSKGKSISNATARLPCARQRRPPVHREATSKGSSHKSV